MDQSPIFWIIVALIIFIVSREILLWYWKISTIVKYQEEQLDLMDAIISELRIQTITLRTLMYGEEEEAEETKDTEEKENTEKSTP